MIAYIFLFLAFVSVLCGALVVFSKNPVHSVLYLVVTFFTIAGQYVLLNAQFLAVVHIIVYAGAIMILFMFVIMLLNLNKETEPHKTTWVKLSAVIAAGLLFLVFIGALKGLGAAPITGADSSIGLVENLGKVLFTDFLLPFEVSAILFLTAMVGAVMLGKKEIK